MILSEIKEYVCKNIITEYSNFDKGHGFKHVEKVIDNSLSIASDYEVNMNMVYVVAAYHDIGLKKGRENHEKTSGILLFADQNLRRWFTENELCIMKEAVEDHRASNDCEPRSIYGKIVADADRDIEYITILTRTIHYSLNNYPEYTFEQHFERTYSHIQNKYGESGYLKLWLNTESNKSRLEELRHSIKSIEKLKSDFTEIFYSL